MNRDLRLLLVLMNLNWRMLALIVASVALLYIAFEHLLEVPNTFNRAYQLIYLIPVSPGEPHAFMAFNPNAPPPTPPIYDKLLLTPLDIGPTIFPMHIGLSILLGYLLYSHKAARIRSDEFRALPEFKFPDRPIWSAAVVILPVTLFVWSILDVTVSREKFAVTYWGLHLYATDPTIWFMRFSPYDVWYAYPIFGCYVLMGLILQSALALYLYSWLKLVKTLIAVCIYSLFRNIAYTWVHAHFWRKWWEHEAFYSKVENFQHIDAMVSVRFFVADAMILIVIFLLVFYLRRRSLRRVGAV